MRLLKKEFASFNNYLLSLWQTFRVMQIEHVTLYLNDYINMDDPQYAVMLKGKWGCGKTYYIKKLIESWNKEAKDCDEKITLKPVYISLNGVSSTSQVSHMIRKELKPFLYSKGMKVAKCVLLGTIKTVTKIGIDINGDGQNDELTDIFDAESILDILSKSNDSVSGGKIVVFDDLERCKIPTDEIFGYINNLSEHSKCKIIIIGEEDKIKEMYDNSNLTVKYKDFKEKLIGQTFSIKQDTKKIINEYITNSKCVYLKKNKDLVLELFISSKIENLRIIKQCFSDFNRLVNLMNPSDFKEDLFDDFIKNVLAYFVITYCEYKGGNENIKKFQDFHYFYKDEDKAREKIRQLENKYNNILVKHSIKNSIYSIKIEDIIHFIENGFIPDIQLLLKSNDILNVRTMADWEILWEFYQLDNSTFNSKLSVVKKMFYRENIDYISIVLHISGMFLHFNKIGIAKCNEADVVKTAKRQINAIYKNVIEKQEDKLFPGLHGASWGKKYMEVDSPKMTDLINYSNKKLEKYNEEKLYLYCKKFWENINDESCENINNYFEQATPNGYSKCSYASIFNKINAKKTALKILRLSNKSKIDLSYYLSFRYYLPGSSISGPIQDFHIQDLSTLEIIKNILEEKVKRLKQLDKIATIQLIQTLEQCISQLIAAKAEISSGPVS